MPYSIGGVGVNPGTLAVTVGVAGVYSVSAQVGVVGLEVYIDGVLDERAVSARCSFGFDQRYAEAVVTRVGGTKYPTPDPSPVAIGYWSDIEIKMGVSNVATRFRGWIVPVENTIFPQENRLVCKGRLYLAEWFKNESDQGLDLSENGVGHADEGQVRTILAACGVPYSAGNIGGTGKLLGSVYTSIDALTDATSEVTPGPTPFWWSPGQSGLDYIRTLDEVSVGDDASLGRYTTFESLDGTVYRMALTAQPASAEDFTFTEGQDILDDSASITRDPSNAANRQRVNGMTDVIDRLKYIATTSSAPYMPSIVPVNPDAGFRVISAPVFSSEMIEKELIADDGDVISCEAMAQTLLLQRNAVVETVKFETPRDDELGPAQTILVNAPTLGTVARYWLRHLDVECDLERGTFTQRLECTKNA